MLSKTADYALRTVVCLANEDGKPMSASVLAQQTKVPRRYLNRVLQNLVGSGLVQSTAGRTGGYQLDKSVNQITILDVVTTVDPIRRIKECPLGVDGHTVLCPLHRELDKAYAATEQAYRSVTIAELVESTTATRPLCQQNAISDMK